MDCGDKQQLEKLYETVGRPALGKTMNLVHSPQVAEEILHEVFADLWQQRRTFDSLRKAYAWVYRCCTNKAIDHLRKKANQSSSFDEENCPKPFHNDSSFDSLSVKTIWNHIQSTWPKDEIAVFVYRYMEGLSQQEVCEVMEVSRRTVNRLQEKVEIRLKKIRGEEHVK